MSDCKFNKTDAIVITIIVVCMLAMCIVFCNAVGRLPEHRFHASACQCNECVLYKCECLNHGDTCQCDKCLECKNIGGTYNEKNSIKKVG